MRCDGSFYWLQNRTRYQVAPPGTDDYILSDDRFRILCQSALHLAVAKNHTKVAKLLLSQQQGEIIHCTDFTGRTPLHEAVRQNHAEMAELLIENGARVSRKCRSYQNLSADYLSKRKCPCKVSRNAKCNEKAHELEEYSKDLCHCGSTPFLLSARYGHMDVGSLLLRHGANPKDMDCQGATPLHVAACHGHYSFISWLITQRPFLNVNLRSKNQSTLLHSSVICKNNKDIKPLIDMGASIYDTDQFGMTPLHYAVLNDFENSGIVMFDTTTKSENFYVPSFTKETFAWGLKGDFTVARDSRILKRTVPCNFQCLKLLELTKLADTSIYYINKADRNGSTALHLAAQNGEECCVLQLLKRGARTDLTDNKGRTPLDVAVEFAEEEFDTYFLERGDCSMEMRCRNVEESFDVIRALNLRNHHSVADILLSREAYLTQTCDKSQAYLLHKAFGTEKAVIADQILSKGGNLRCKDKDGRTPLLIYLQNGGKWLDVVLKRFNVTIKIECGKPFNISEFHLLAFRKPTVPSNNPLERYDCSTDYGFIEDGPLAKAIKAHPLGLRVIDECRDEEGYTALHRAAQGGNLVTLKKFLSWGADPTLLTRQGHSALTLAIMAGISPFPSVGTRQTAEQAADLLRRAITRNSRLDVGCNSGEAKLTIYHLSAYAGLTGFVKTLLKDTSYYGVDVNCSNIHGITPLYLAKLNINKVKNISDGKKDPWQETVNLIEKRGGVLTYPNREVELSLLYKHLFGSHPSPFSLDPFEASSAEQFYKSDVSQCRERGFSYYKNGTLINPYEEAVNSELLRIIMPQTESNINSQMIPRDFGQLRTLLATLGDKQKASGDLSRLFADVLKGLERAELESMRRCNESNTSPTSSQSTELPKFVIKTSPRLMQDMMINRKDLIRQEQELRESRFKHESSKAIISHRNKYLKNILHKHRAVYGDTTELVKLLEKYEESELCLEEIFQADLLQLKFTTYVLRSQIDDYLSFTRTILDKFEFIVKRVPNEWLPGDAKNKQGSSWNQAVKFLYQQATERDLTFDYLQVLSFGRDKDTRIPLSMDALFSLSLKN